MRFIFYNLLQIKLLNISLYCISRTVLRLEVTWILLEFTGGLSEICERLHTVCTIIAYTLCKNSSRVYIIFIIP